MVELTSLSIGYRNGKKSRSRRGVVAGNIHGVLEQGSLVCLVGVNGVGKSTLLRTIAGFLPPVEGNVLISPGKGAQRVPVSRLTENERARAIGVVLTENSVLDNLTAFDVVSFGRTPYTGFWGVLSQDDRKVVTEAFHRVGITDLMNRQMDELSDGERQKVMIAKTLAQQTSIILLDEPSAFLDYPSKHNLMVLLKELASCANKAILFSSHDLDIVQLYADSFWIMEKGPESVTLRTSAEL
jgi:iron complex transport system ATP-binding protein